MFFQEREIKCLLLERFRKREMKLLLTLLAATLAEVVTLRDNDWSQIKQVFSSTLEFFTRLGTIIVNFVTISLYIFIYKYAFPSCTNMTVLS